MDLDSRTQYKLVFVGYSTQCHFGGFGTKPKMTLYVSPLHFTASSSAMLFKHIKPLNKHDFY